MTAPWEYPFLDRIEVTGTFGVSSSTHWIPTHVAMGVLERGGNAFDAAVAAAFAFQVVEPHMNGLGGEAVVMAWPASSPHPIVVCGQGVAPARATVDHFRALGFDRVPGTGLLAAVVPGAFDAWMVTLRDFGTIDIEAALTPAIGYAMDGFPTTNGLSRVIARSAELFRSDWRGSAAIYLPGDKVPMPGDLLSNRPLAATYRRLIEESKAGGGERERRIEAARKAFYEGFVADTVEQFVRHDASDGGTNRSRGAGLITAADMAGWRATLEPAISYVYRGAQIFKPGPWSQGPVLLQILALLKGLDSKDVDPVSPEFLHVFVEAAKLAFADREAWYGDAGLAAVPLPTLLDDRYNQRRRALIAELASDELRPGMVPGRIPRLPAYAEAAPSRPAMLRVESGDTCHLNVIDRWGNMVSATPSGGWMYGSPVIPDLGLSLNTRAQMFWLDKQSPSGLVPGKRPRTTLSPAMAALADGTRIAFGSRGADHADQWLALFTLYLIDGAMGLQNAIDAPMIQCEHWPDSVFPRRSHPKRVVLSPRIPAPVVDELAARGHAVAIGKKYRLGRICAALKRGKELRAAATARLPEAAAAGR
jgi:gamma-glutamyltranspeptidase / glutathione hydrolase